MDSPMRVAAVDCGTNSIRLLIADVTCSSLEPVGKDMQIVRLGRGVDATGRLDQGAMDRALTATREYRSQIERHGVKAMRFCATSAVRDAYNASDFSDQVLDVLGVRPEVLSGDEEAELSFIGATRGLAGHRQVPTTVIDIGGGSTELVVGTGDTVAEGVSLDVGSVRLTERFVESDPPTEVEITACRSYVADALGQVTASYASAECLVGVAGTITTVAAYVLGLSSYDSDAIHGARLPLDQVQSACGELIHMSVAQRRALPFMHPGRADVIGAGALILSEVITAIGVNASELVVSESDILDGIAWSAASLSGAPFSPGSSD